MKVIVKSLSIVVNAVIIAVCFCISDVAAMSMPQHLNGVDDLGGLVDLIGTPPRAGGVGNMSVEKLKNISAWMDNPSTRTGEFINRKLIEPKALSPWNHGALRHNPTNTANAMYGKSSTFELKRELFGQQFTEMITPDDYLAKLNAARMHKISDVAHNVADVDGHAITQTMKKEAEVVSRYVRRYHKLPERLPAWVDSAGSGVVAKAGSSTVKVLSTASKVSSYAAPPLIVGMTLYNAYEVEQQFQRGEIDEKTRVTKLSGITGGCAMALGGVGLALVLTPAGPVLVTLAVTGAVCYALEYAGEKAFEYAAAYIYEKDYNVRLAQAKLYYSAAGTFDIAPELFDRAGVSQYNKQAYREAYNEYQQRIAKQQVSPEILVINSDDVKTLEIANALADVDFNNREIAKFLTKTPELTIN